MAFSEKVSLKNHKKEIELGKPFQRVYENLRKTKTMSLRNAHQPPLSSMRWDYWVLGAGSTKSDSQSG